MLGTARGPWGDGGGSGDAGQHACCPSMEWRQAHAVPHSADSFREGPVRQQSRGKVLQVDRRVWDIRAQGVTGCDRKEGAVACQGHLLG